MSGPALDAHAVLRLWEAGGGGTPSQRATALLAALEPGGPDPADLPVGQRDARILALRARLAGDVVACVTECPGCGERLEFALTVTQPVAGSESGPVDAQSGALRAQVRQATGADLDAVAALPAGRRREELLRRCVDDCRRDGAAVGPGELSAQELEAVAAPHVAAHPLADVTVRLECPGCGGRVEEPVDPALFLTEALRERARVLLDEVDALARAYGWSEAEVLRLSPLRRRAYLERAGT